MTAAGTGATLMATQAEAVLRAAARSEFGIRVRVIALRDDIMTPALRARQVLYRFRNELGAEEFKDLQIRLSPDDPEHRLWIIRGGLTSDAERSPEDRTRAPSIIDLDAI